MTTNRTALIAKVNKVLKKHYKPVAPPADRTVLEHLLYACLLENSRFDAADEAFARLRESYFDWNEIRVTTVTELAEGMAGLPDASAAAQRVKKSLQSIFEAHYSYDLDGLKKQNLGKAEKDLEKINGASPFVRAYVTQNALGGHSIPVAPGALDVLYGVGVVNDAEADRAMVPGLERAIPKNKGGEFFSLLHQLGADYTASPGSTKLKAMLAEIEPDFKQRLASRQTRLEEVAKVEAAAAKEARHKARAEARAAAEQKPSPRAGSSKPGDKKSVASSAGKAPSKGKEPPKPPQTAPGTRKKVSEARITSAKGWPRKSRVRCRARPRAPRSSLASARLEVFMFRRAVHRRPPAVSRAPAQRCYRPIVERVGLALCLAVLATGHAAAQHSPHAAGPSQGEAEDDRVEATVHLLQARLAQGRGDLAAALRGYQRAWRYAPEEAPVLREIVPLAFELKRSDEAARYAVLSAERDPSDPTLLRSLALLVSQQRDWSRALRLYESAARLEAEQRPPDAELKPTDLAVTMELGRLYYLTGQFDRSAESFAAVRDAIDSGDVELSAESRRALLGEGGETYALWAEAFLEAGRHAEAAALFRRTHQSKPNAPLLAWHLARVEAAEGNPASARRLLEEYFDSNSSEGGAGPYELFAKQVSEHQADPAAAGRTTIERFEQLRLRDPLNPYLLQALARQYFDANQLDKAEPIFVALAATHARGETYRKLVEIYRRQVKPERLAAVLAQFVARTGTLDGLGDAGQSLAADRISVQRLVGQIRNKRRTDPASLAEGELLAIGLVALEAQEWTAADELLAAAAEEADAAGRKAVLLRWGLGMMLAEQYPRAARAFQRIIDEQANGDVEATPYYYLAAALEMSGEHDRAIAAARKGAELAPDEPQMAVRPAWILYHADKLDAAREAYLEFVKKFDDRHDSPAIRGTLREARLALSAIELARGDFPAAVEWLEQVLDEFPEDASANNDLGYLWADRGIRLERALRMIEFAVQQEPEKAAYRDSLGWVYYRLGRYDEAAKELETAAADPAGQLDGVILDHLGDALQAAGRTADARAAWRKSEAAFEKEGNAAKLDAVRQKLLDPKTQEPTTP
jgi:tetratricopeptide (TPR) repeat protein/endonuclease III